MSKQQASTPTVQLVQYKGQILITIKQTPTSVNDWMSFAGETEHRFNLLFAALQTDSFAITKLPSFQKGRNTYRIQGIIEMLTRELSKKQPAGIARELQRRIKMLMNINKMRENRLSHPAIADRRRKPLMRRAIKPTIAQQLLLETRVNQLIEPHNSSLKSQLRSIIENHGHLTRDELFNRRASISFLESSPKEKNRENQVANLNAQKQIIENIESPFSYSLITFMTRNKSDIRHSNPVHRENFRCENDKQWLLSVPKEGAFVTPIAAIIGQIMRIIFKSTMKETDDEIAQKKINTQQSITLLAAACNSKIEALYGYLFKKVMKLFTSEISAFYQIPPLDITLKCNFEGFQTAPVKRKAPGDIATVTAQPGLSLLIAAAKSRGDIAKIRRPKNSGLALLAKDAEAQRTKKQAAAEIARPSTPKKSGKSKRSRQELATLTNSPGRSIG